MLSTCEEHQYRINPRVAAHSNTHLQLLLLQLLCGVVRREGLGRFRGRRRNAGCLIERSLALHLAQSDVIQIVQIVEAGHNQHAG